jgi:putative membrane protein
VYIDYLTLMLVNMVAGLVLLAAWIFLDGEAPAARRWVPMLAISALLALATGLHMIFTWPLPGSFNILFGEMAVFYGVLLVGIAVSLALGLDLLPVAIYAAFAGLASVVIGAQVLNLELTKSPPLSGASFIWMGLIGLGAVPMLRLRGLPAFRIFGTVGLLIAALLWAVTGYRAYWGHVEPFAKWKPVHLQYQLEMNQPRAQ